MPGGNRGGVRGQTAGRADSGGSTRLPLGGRTAARLWRPRWWPKPTGSAVQPVGAARHSLVLLGFGRERATQRSGVARALETKFLRFWTGQERDGVLSLPPSTASFRPKVLESLVR